MIIALHEYQNGMIFIFKRERFLLDELNTERSNLLFWFTVF